MYDCCRLRIEEFLSSCKRDDVDFHGGLYLGACEGEVSLNAALLLMQRSRVKV